MGVPPNRCDPFLEGFGHSRLWMCAQCWLLAAKLERPAVVSYTHVLLLSTVCTYMLIVVGRALLLANVASILTIAGSVRLYPDDPNSVCWLITRK